MSNVSLLVNTKMFILQLMKCTVNKETLDLSLERQQIQKVSYKLRIIKTKAEMFGSIWIL